jgi:hypothetical protein
LTNAAAESSGRVATINSARRITAAAAPPAIAPTPALEWPDPPAVPEACEPSAAARLVRRPFDTGADEFPPPALEVAGVIP